MTAALAAALVLPGAAFAEEDGHTGGGGGGGGHTDDTTGSLYSDLVIALRAVDGTPVLKKFVVPPGEGETEQTIEYCVQPISREAVPGVTSTLNPVDGSEVWALPLQGEWITNPPTGDLPVAELEVCDPQPQYATFVTEVELERLNLARTSDDVIAEKLAEVATKLKSADEIGLDGAGRITVDGTAIDASPEYAAIYDSLMTTGTLPGLPTDMAGPPAQIDIFDAWELAAAAVGTASGKEVPINVDTIEYYNRSIGFPPDETYVSPWGVDFIRSENPDDPGVEMTTGERFVDYGGFSYNRSEVYKGSVTWLDVPNLEWRVDRILDVVDFGDEDLDTTTLTGVRAFAQLADDVRAVILYYHENEVIPGFYMDPVGVDTTEEQEAAIVNPAVDLGDLPDSVFPTLPFEMTASLFNPWGGTLIDEGRLRITVDAPEPLEAGDVVAIARADAQTVPFTADTDGDLIGWWGPETGFPVEPGYTESTTFDVTIAGTAPTGDYNVTLELVDVDELGTALATDSGVLTVNANVATVLWGDPLPQLATQGTAVKIPVQVYSPEAGTGVLTLSIAGPGDDPATEEDESLVAGDVKVYGSDGTTMVTMPLDVDADGALVGTWNAALAAGYTTVTWYLSVVEGAPAGAYTVDVAFADSSLGADAAEPFTIAVAAPVDHKAPNAPVVEEKSVVGDSATIVVSSSSKDVTYFEFVLVKDFTHLRVDESYDGSWTYTDLNPGAYKAKVTAVDKAGNRSATVNVLFEIADSSTGGGGGVITDPTTPADPGDGDPVVPPVDPEEPGDGAGEGGKPDTFIGKGPRSRSFVLGHSVTYRLRSNGDDVQYRVVLNNRFDQLCDSNVCVVDGLKSGKNVLRFAAQANGQRDDTPVVRKIFVPRKADGMRMTERWTVRENVRAFEGDLARTNQAGQVIRTRARDIRRIALVVAKGKGNGRVEVYLGQRLLTSTPIDLSNPTNQHQVLVPVATFRKLQTGFVRVKVVSQGKPVRIEGIGIVNR